MATEERRLMDLARTVPAILLLVGTSGKAVASIKCARELFAGKKWEFDDSDDPESPPPNANRGGNGSGGGEPVETTTGGGDHGGSGVPSKTTCGSQAQASLPCGVSVDIGGYWADVLASALAHGEGHLPVAYREITRLVSLHAEAGHVFVNCAARTGLQPHRAAPWKRWMDLREAAVCHAHDALLALSSAAAAATAAEDFLRWRSAESPRREGWRSAARQLVKDARRSLGDAKDAARLMRDAVLCEFFVTWMILTRA
ncbi:unnamed protein product [Miscanthus lutarioriparius]|uniref:Uncharacterized protein n=1 Tax=Miscanthus lutarioriparius TaxID=422564 RepID=A0A811PAF8_9POAL|nr:unnamed protein product [Miscanthus lutarioriparius]